MTLKQFLEKYCDPLITIAVTDSWYTPDTTFDWRGVADDIIRAFDPDLIEYGGKIVKSIDVFDEVLYILVEK